MPDSFPRAYWSQVQIDRQVCNYGDYSFPNYMEIGARDTLFSTVDQFGPHDLDHVGKEDETGYSRGKRKKRKGRRY